MSREKEEKIPAGKNALEWSVFAVSSLLVLGIIILLGVDALRWGGGPARLEIGLGEAKMEGGQLCVPLRVTNQGDTVAVNVNVDVTAPGGNGAKTASVTFDFIPRGATREGRVIFPPEQDPTKLEARISGYETAP